MENWFNLWLQAFRPKTLSAAIVPVVVGSALAQSLDQQASFLIFVCALFSALFIQIGTNLFNDVLDFKKGADTHERIGPRRVTQSGLISSQKVWQAACGSFIAAVIFGIPLVLEGGWVILGIGVVSLLCGYIYTGGPYPLAYRGWGEVFVILFFGLVAVSGTYYLHTGVVNWASGLAGLQVGLLSTVLIAINNFRDREQDFKADKRTLAVRWGEAFAKREILVLSLLPFILQWFWWKWFNQSPWMLLPLLALPLSLHVAWRTWSTRPSTTFNQELAKASLVHVLFGFSLAVGVLAL